MRFAPTLLATLVALALTTPADAAKRKHRHGRGHCLVEIWSPDTGPQCFGAPSHRRFAR